MKDFRCDFMSKNRRENRSVTVLQLFGFTNMTDEERTALQSGSHAFADESDVYYPTSGIKTGLVRSVQQGFGIFLAAAEM